MTTRLISGPPVVVCGLGRCGSSMVMQMLVSGGLRLTGDAKWPMCEDTRATDLPEKRQWLRNVTDRHCLKILNPDRFRLPRWFECYAVWLDRDQPEQVKSWIKYGEAVRGYRPHAKKLTMGQIKNIIRSRTEKGVKVMRQVALRFMRLQFEDVILDPIEAARSIELKFCKGLDVVAMAQAVQPRGPQCLEGFLELYNSEQHV